MKNETLMNICENIRQALNTEAGQELTEQILNIRLRKNPNMSEEEIEQTKADIIQAVFFTGLKMARAQ